MPLAYIEIKYSKTANGASRYYELLEDKNKHCDLNNESRAR
jgi:hypothetical protein